MSLDLGHCIGICRWKRLTLMHRAMQYTAVIGFNTHTYAYYICTYVCTCSICCCQIGTQWNCSMQLWSCIRILGSQQGVKYLSCFRVSILNSTIDVTADSNTLCTHANGITWVSTTLYCSWLIGHSTLYNKQSGPNPHTLLLHISFDLSQSGFCGKVMQKGFRLQGTSAG